MDRNQLIGIILIGALLITYFALYTPPEREVKKNDITQAQRDSIANLSKDEEQENNGSKSANSISELRKQLPDSLLQIQVGAFSKAIKGTEQNVTLENEELRIVLSSKGGGVEEAELKNYKTFEGKPLILFDKNSNYFNVGLQTNTLAGDLLLNDLYFEVNQKSKREVEFTIDFEGKTFKQSYILSEDGFVLAYNANFDVLRNYLRKDRLKVEWKDNLKRLEQDYNQSRLRSGVNYYTIDGDFEEFASSSGLDNRNVSQPVRWFTMQQRFFNSGLITEKQFERLDIRSEVNENDSSAVKILWANFEIPLEALSADANARYYFGPNDYGITKTVATDYEKNVYLGWQILTPISKWIILPLFDMLERFISNYGIIIIILVLIIKLVLSPLTYKSYLAAARMRVIQPEINALKEKYKDDQQRFSQEQMKLFSQLGVSPLSGCLPMLLQMPITFALFTFFPTAIQLRGESFLWAQDLSSYDSILDLPFNIPFYGAHISLFTLLMAVSQIFVTMFTANQSTANSAQSPINMKYIMYAMPIMFMFVLNSYPAGLTMYYFISNLIAIGQSWVIRRFIVDEEKIKKVLEERRKKRAAAKSGKSSFRQRLEDTLKQQQEKAAAKQNNNGKKKKN
ncbi:MAG: membrane protein insertase YidC [Bernardetiaceae bacterium]|nr:membrane protein insertase YidC [Bernardetiaceae bacterium]